MCYLDFDWFEIKSGLVAGDELVVGGSETLADGMKIRAARDGDGGAGPHG